MKTVERFVIRTNCIYGRHISGGLQCSHRRLNCLPESLSIFWSIQTFYVLSNTLLNEQYLMECHWGSRNFISSHRQPFHCNGSQIYFYYPYNVNSMLRCSDVSCFPPEIDRVHKQCSNSIAWMKNSPELLYSAYIHTQKVNMDFIEKWNESFHIIRAVSARFRLCTIKIDIGWWVLHFSCWLNNYSIAILTTHEIFFLNMTAYGKIWIVSVLPNPRSLNRAFRKSGWWSIRVSLESEVQLKDNAVWRICDLTWASMAKVGLTQTPDPETFKLTNPYTHQLEDNYLTKFHRNQMITLRVH